MLKMSLKKTSLLIFLALLSPAVFASDSVVVPDATDAKKAAKKGSVKNAPVVVADAADAADAAATPVDPVAAELAAHAAKLDKEYNLRNDHTIGSHSSTVTKVIEEDYISTRSAFEKPKSQSKSDSTKLNLNYSRQDNPLQNKRIKYIIKSGLIEAVDGSPKSKSTSWGNYVNAPLRDEQGNTFDSSWDCNLTGLSGVAYNEFPFLLAPHTDEVTNYYTVRGKLYTRYYSADLRERDAWPGGDYFNNYFYYDVVNRAYLRNKTDLWTVSVVRSQDWNPSMLWTCTTMEIR